MCKLDDKVAIITGASGGIGTAAAALFAAEGARVMLVDLDGDRLAGLVRTIGEEKAGHAVADVTDRSEEHPSEIQSLMRISYAVFCLKKKKIRLPPDIRYATS